MTKYKEYFNKMFAAHQVEFEAFKGIHDQYQAEPMKFAKQFHGEGMKLMEIIKDWERRLCLQMERGQNSSYSAKLAEKFMAEVQKYLPLVNRIGVRSSRDGTL